MQNEKMKIHLAHPILFLDQCRYDTLLQLLMLFLALIVAWFRARSCTAAKGTVSSCR